jgi:hypothetical protein
MARPFDTSPDAQAAQLMAWRRMGPARRVELAADMSEEARRVTMSGIRSRHPEYTAEELRNAMLRLVLGDELYVAAWPGRPLLAP